MLISQSPFSYFPQNLKTSSALPFVLASIFKKENNLDDCLLLNTAGRLACGSSSNVFLVKNGELLTPPLTEGCVAGTMRAALFDLAKQLGTKAAEVPIALAELGTADEIFLTNAIQGIRWVRQVTGVDKRYNPSLSKNLVEEINRRFLLG